ncbi:MAG: DivIVA domain-containing protein [Solirubrobacteraceae bacterium]
MNSFHRPPAGQQEKDGPQEPARSPFADIAGRFANWMTGADRLPAEGPLGGDEPEIGPMAHAPRPAPPPAPPESDDAARFPLAPFGYNRAAVDEHLAELERELAEVRAKQGPAVSITEELERIGEQTASILVVAHDKAHETTRLAQEQAERCVADAAANAVAMTEDAKRRLRDLDNETDAVWRERERLLEDVRVVSVALANLADQASERFPAAEPAATVRTAFPVGAPAHRAALGIWNQPAEPAGNGVIDAADPRDPQATEPFDALNEFGEAQ